MQSVTRTHKEMHMVRPKYGTIGLSYLLHVSEHLFHIWSIIIILNKWTKFEANLVLGSISGE